MMDEWRQAAVPLFPQGSPDAAVAMAVQAAPVADEFVPSPSVGAVGRLESTWCAFRRCSLRPSAGPTNAMMPL